MSTPSPRFDDAVRSPLQAALTAIERRAALRRTTGLQFVVADRVDLLNATAWDALTAHHGLMLSRDYLSALERAAIPSMQHRYALAFDGQRPIAAVSMQLLDVGRDRLHAVTTPPPFPGLDLTPLEQRLRQRVLICGNSLSAGLDGVAFAEGVDPERRWRAVAEVLYRVRRAEKLNGHANLVVIKDLDQAQQADSETLRGLSYRPLPTEPTMVLELEPHWRCHDDYLASMQSKFRSAVKRKVYGTLEEAGVAVDRLTAAEVAQHAERLQALHLAVQDNADVRPVTVSTRYWTEMAALGHERAIFTALRAQGTVLGFLLLLVDGEEVSASQIGFDREAAKTLPLYLRLLHTATEVGLERGAKRVVFGRTALEPKARLGAKPVSTMMWARHRQPLVNSVTGGLLQLWRHAEAPDIDPFKRPVAS